MFFKSIGDTSDQKILSHMIIQGSDVAISSHQSQFFHGKREQEDIVPDL